MRARSLLSLAWPLQPPKELSSPSSHPFPATKDKTKCCPKEKYQRLPHQQPVGEARHCYLGWDGEVTWSIPRRPRWDGEATRSIPRRPHVPPLEPNPGQGWQSLPPGETRACYLPAIPEVQCHTSQAVLRQAGGALSSGSADSRGGPRTVSSERSSPGKVGSSGGVQRSREPLLPPVPGLTADSTVL